ncbi:hypothetical protein BDA96_10G209600 [Sorghum bicolor]|jgi:hypothetical protein|uniref:Phospholipase A1 n=2 Tax=Sorghum bicolor TaxID=4558 RepID=A0A921U1L2_SORBI|nr:phospholipase A1-II 7 [Sorghum bicolor]XP_002438518.1 phospholipase A1-II 7 [Sorghum bicolor]EER88480.1 hypothetical protein SORBI_3010G159900 [Sorghum bicolor]EER89885.1 hypothetical protein SORBI_3010G160000 [Sorghum bicolor]KAG0514629.1 hypothetical protein BDA96_10G209400 [Sorghum bicolor]KAG0514631.1 hypothetical protein BDA96_10G209600 [Sorghum bicolor]|eukprot:XP_002437113.1 phospholipase A1-II 7 [Sorghum bicolor]
MASSATASGNGSIAERWRELQGEHSWNGLLDPLDLDLRKSIISYGELVSAALDGFNNEKRSPHAGDCMYGTTDLLSRSTVAAAGNYRVTKFIYATAAEPALRDAFLVLPNAALRDPWSTESNWIGYVAVATDDGVAALGRRDILVAWRGTLALESLKDVGDALVPTAPALGQPLGSVHGGFLSLYTSSDAGSEFNKISARAQVLEEVRNLVEQYKDEVTSITVAGHSLGASLATLNAIDMVANGVNGASSQPPPCPVSAVVFASPRVGDESFAAAFRSFGDQLRALHVKNSGDQVTLYPTAKGYSDDVAVTLPVNPSLSPYLRSPATQQTLHNLECYLHGVAGEQGSAGGFNLEVCRDEALVNKDADGLKDEYHVPASWWVVLNKSMVKNAKGKWELRDFE